MSCFYRVQACGKENWVNLWFSSFGLQFFIFTLDFGIDLSSDAHRRAMPSKWSWMGVERDKNDFASIMCLLDFSCTMMVMKQQTSARGVLCGNFRLRFFSFPLQWIAKISFTRRCQTFLSPCATLFVYFSSSLWCEFSSLSIFIRKNKISSIISLNDVRKLQQLWEKLLDRWS